MIIILGITGSIGAYKAVDIMRLFQKSGHTVKVILTRNAQKFITPLTFETFSPGNVYTDMFDNKGDALAHINLCRDSDLLLIAPASANIIGKIANGIADDLLSSLFLAFYKKIAIAPAMNCHMLENPAVKQNLSRLDSRGIAIIEPDEGSLACQYEGRGRLPDPQRIVESCIRFASPSSHA